jgi:hypothetical protein
MSSTRAAPPEHRSSCRHRSCVPTPPSVRIHSPRLHALACTETVSLVPTLMLWFFERDQHSARLETRYDNGTAEYVAVAKYPERPPRDREIRERRPVSALARSVRARAPGRTLDPARADPLSFPTSGHTDGRSRNRAEPHRTRIPEGEPAVRSLRPWRGNVALRRQRFNWLGGPQMTGTSGCASGGRQVTRAGRKP